MRRAGLLLLACAAGCLAQDLPRELVQFVAWPKNPVFVGRGGHWDASLRERGFVLAEPDGYHLWYGGGSPAVTAPALGYATSPDGLDWARPGAAPILPPRVEDPMVLRTGGRYILVAETADDSMALYWSTDRVHWQARGPIHVLDTRGHGLAERTLRGTPTLFHHNEQLSGQPGGLYYLFYEIEDNGIWVATSGDLVTFRNVQDYPVLTLGPGPSDELQMALNQVIERGGRYYGHYSGLGRAHGWSCNVAVSDDLVHWQKGAKNPITDVADSMASCILVPDGDGFRMYAMRGDGTLHVFFNPR